MWDIDGNEQFIGFNIGFEHPDFRRRGFGPTLLSFNERRLKEIATQLIKTERIPLDSPAFYDHYVFQDEKDRMALLTRHAYQPVRYEFGMLRPNLEDIPAAPMTPGLEVRPVLPEHYQLIYRASCEAFRDHWGSLLWPEEDFDNMLNDPDFDPSLWRVTWDGDQVAGAVLVVAVLTATRPKLQPVAASERVWVVDAVTIRHETLQPELDLFGEVIAGRRRELRVLVAGPIARVGTNFATAAW